MEISRAEPPPNRGREKGKATVRGITLNSPGAGFIPLLLRVSPGGRQEGAGRREQERFGRQMGTGQVGILPAPGCKDPSITQTGWRNLREGKGKPPKNISSSFPGGVQAKGCCYGREEERAELCPAVVTHGEGAAESIRNKSEGMKLRDDCLRATCRAYVTKRGEKTKNQQTNRLHMFLL